MRNNKPYKESKKYYVVMGELSVCDYDTNPALSNKYLYLKRKEIR